MSRVRIMEVREFEAGRNEWRECMLVKKRTVGKNEMFSACPSCA